MKTFHSFEAVPGGFGPSVVAIGNFDGVHAGHRVIMRRVREIAAARGLTPAILTFDPHPARVLAPERAPKLLMTVEQRLGNIEREGMEAVLLLPFSLEFAKLTPEEFARRVLVDVLGAKVVLVGEDFRFGYKQGGDVGTLGALGARLGFEVEPIAPILLKSERISSTAVRKLVTSGKVSRAWRMLGEPFALQGRVVAGHGIGKKQTVPTLNLATENEVLPAVGVYITRTRECGSDREWKSITNVGYRPTFDGHDLTIETFLLDPLVGEPPEAISVSFLAFLRSERKFETPEALKSQIMRDVRAAAGFHRRLALCRVG